MRRSRTHLPIYWALAVLICAGGCGHGRARIELVTYDEDGTARHHYADFDRASYRQLPGGLVELAMRAERPSTIDPTQTITQILLIRTFWNPQPARTWAEATQINARVQYAMLTPPTGIRYDGAAFLTYRKRRGQITGHVESATLAPRYRMGQAVEPFDTARFTGTIRAKENPGEVVRLAQTIEAQFREALAME
jgi:hypothetical protein